MEGAPPRRASFFGRPAPARPTLRPRPSPQAGGVSEGASIAPKTGSGHNGRPGSSGDRPRGLRTRPRLLRDQWLANRPGRMESVPTIGAARASTRNDPKDIAMPKIKTHRGEDKRIRKNASGNYQTGQANR